MVFGDPTPLMATMTDTPYLVHVPVLTGGYGREAVREFYASYFVGRWPKDTKITQLSRTIGEDRVVDELIMHEGAISGFLNRGEFSEHSILQLAVGAQPN